jgi:NitT/TauT family transport system substrate-binding protein
VVALSKGQTAKSFADLKGLKVGVTSPGSSTHQGFNYLMSRAGLAPDSYTPVGVGNSAGSVAATKMGKVDANVIVEPIVSLLLAGNDMTMLMDGRTEEKSRAAFGGAFPEGGFYGREDFIKKNPKTIQALTNGLVRANEWLQKASPTEIVAALPPEIVGSDPDTFGKSADNMRSCFSPDGLIAEEGPPHVLEILQASEPELKNAKIDISQTYTNDFVREALKKYPVK